MENEKQAEHSVLADDEIISDKTGAKPASHRLAYKTVLAAVVIGILTISVLWVLVIRQDENPANAIEIADSDIQVHEGIEEKGSEAVRIKDEYEAIDRRLASMSGQIDRGFETQQTDSTDVKRNLTVMSESLQTINVAVADLSESNKELSQRINGVTSRLDALVKNVRALKVVKRKSSAKHKPRLVKIPPFHIDAIDMWDDITYVAVSQTGRAAFLKVGEQRAGWTVIRIDRLKGQVDLQGPAGQAHSVLLQR
ncbi:MAG TPA: hypothetical protein ENJ35_02215 [Gammaproteobacteria bacterium]|nr:hypothetical protein [Gammaproteobacteria bacterium]